MTRLRSLPVDEQAEMLAGAAKLLLHPETLSTPMESEVRILGEQACLALGKTFTT